MPRRYWLMKCEPDAYTIDDLARDGRTPWEGVRNYQARNFMRDQMQEGDGVLFYASNADPSGVTGLAEIARAGILSVDRGQAEAAQALGMSSGQTMRRVVLPQAMRVIVPPTGNETIAMVKDTSLLIAVPVITELNYQTSAIGARTFQIMPALVASTAWYLLICSILMVGQFYLERYFGRGFGQKRAPKASRAARPAGAGGA